MAETWWLWHAGAGAPADNMAWDEALLEQVRVLGRPVLRLYGWREPAATFGYSQRYADVARWTALRPLIRRPTGGGLVPHHADWTYSFVVPPGHGWYALKARESYQRMHEWIQAAFSHVGTVTRLAPCCNPAAPGQCFIGAEQFDVLWNERKLAGAAQRRNQLGLLIQGSIQPPSANMDRSAWEQAMIETATSPDGGRVSWEELKPGHALEKIAHQLAATKYSQASFNERR